MSEFEHCGAESPIRWFSDSRILAELACLIDAVPREHRRALVKNALCCTSEADFGRGSFLTVCRAQLYECLRERLDVLPSIAAVRRIDPARLDARVQPLVEAADPAQTALALCDLVSCVTERLTASQPDAMQHEQGDDQ